MSARDPLVTLARDQYRKLFKSPGFMVGEPIEYTPPTRELQEYGLTSAKAWKLPLNRIVYVGKDTDDIPTVAIYMAVCDPEILKKLLSVVKAVGITTKVGADDGWFGIPAEFVLAQTDEQLFADVIDFYAEHMHEF